MQWANFIAISQCLFCFYSLVMRPFKVFTNKSINNRVTGTDPFYERIDNLNRGELALTDTQGKRGQGGVGQFIG